MTCTCSYARTADRTHAALVQLGWTPPPEAAPVPAGGERDMRREWGFRWPGDEEAIGPFWVERSAWEIAGALGAVGHAVEVVTRMAPSVDPTPWVRCR